MLSFPISPRPLVSHWSSLEKPQGGWSEDGSGVARKRMDLSSAARVVRVECDTSVQPFWPKPTMSSESIPPELLDLIFEHLHNEPAPLKACCTVSKSWVPWARKRLFARVEFHASGSHIELWKKAFPDPSNSPAHHTRNLSIHGSPTITAADADANGWIRTFCNVVLLELSCMDLPSLVQFCQLPSTVRSLRLTTPPSEFPSLIGSFPFLEDLAFIHLLPKSGAGGWDAPLTPPEPTGILTLLTFARARPGARRFLDLPGGFHFSNINARFSDHDAGSVIDLVSRCSGTLECLTITYQGAFPIQPL